MGFLDDVIENVGEPFSGGRKGFEYGTHKVLIMGAESKQKSVKSNPKAEVIEVEVSNEVEDDLRSAICTLYFHTEGGAKMSVAKVLGIIVHNAGEEKKDAVRALGKKLFASVDDPVKARDIATKLINEKLIGKEAYLVAEPQGKYKTTAYGDLWHYEAQPQGAAPKDDVAEELGGEDITGTAEADDIPDFGDDL